MASSLDDAAEILKDAQLTLLPPSPPSSPLRRRPSLRQTVPSYESAPVGILRPKKNVVFSTIDYKAEYDIDEPPNQPLATKRCGSSFLGELYGCQTSYSQPSRYDWPHHERTIFQLVSAVEQKDPRCRAMHTTFIQGGRLFPSDPADAQETRAVFYLGEEFRHFSDGSTPLEIRATFEVPRSGYRRGVYSDSSSAEYYWTQELQEESDSGSDLERMQVSESEESETEVENIAALANERAVAHVESDAKMMNVLMNASVEAVEGIVDAARALCGLDSTAKLPVRDDDEETITEDDLENVTSEESATSGEESEESEESTEERDYDPPVLRELGGTTITDLTAIVASRKSKNESDTPQTESTHPQIPSPTKGRKISWMHKMVSDFRKLKMGDQPQT